AATCTGRSGPRVTSFLPACSSSKTMRITEIVFRPRPKVNFCRLTISGHIGTMRAMSSAQDRDAFSHRLRLSLDRAGWKAIGATGLAREFNRRSGSHPVTAHATRKWLQGEAIPAQGRLQELARWLGVPPQWLRFGDEALLAAAGRPPGVSESSPAPYMPE